MKGKIQFSYISFTLNLAAHCFDEEDHELPSYYVRAILGEHNTQIDGDEDQNIEVEKVLVVIKIKSSHFSFEGRTSQKLISGIHILMA